MIITLEDIKKNLKDNKIYLEQVDNQINNIVYSNNESIFSDIQLKDLLNKKRDNNSNSSVNIGVSSYVNSDVTSDVSSKTIRTYNNKLKYRKNSFILELVKCLHERALLENPCIREFKDKFLNFVNDSKTLEYLKTCSRSHKKLQFKLNETINYDNTDDYINNFPDFVKIICKLFNFNILVISNNIYKLYKYNDGMYLVFNRKNVKHKNDNKKIYKFENDYNYVIEHIVKKNKYYDDKELNKLKIDDLRDLASTFKIIHSKKSDIISEINNICSDF